MMLPTSRQGRFRSERVLSGPCRSSAGNLVLPLAGYLRHFPCRFKARHEKDEADGDIFARLPPGPFVHSHPLWADRTCACAYPVQGPKGVNTPPPSRSNRSMYSAGSESSAASSSTGPLLPLSNQSQDPNRAAQPAAGVNAALGEAFQQSLKSGHFEYPSEGFPAWDICSLCLMHWGSRQMGFLQFKYGP